MPIAEFISKVVVSLSARELGEQIKKAFKDGGTGYDVELNKMLYKVITTYKDGHPNHSTTQIAFYESELIMAKLVKFRFTKALDKEEILKELETDKRIKTPTIQELDDFLTILNEELNKSDKLKDLDIEFNYKEKIFDLSTEIDNAKNDVLKAVNSIKGDLINSLFDKQVLLTEWLTQIDEVSTNIDQFKIQTAYQRLLLLENRIRDEQILNSDRVLSKVLFLEAKCIPELSNNISIKKELQLIVKAHLLDRANIKYKEFAAIAYYLLGQQKESEKLIQEIASVDPFNTSVWTVRCYLKEIEFKSFLESIPEIVKIDEIFKFRIYNWAYYRKYFDTLEEVVSLKIGFNTSQPEIPDITIHNIHFNVSKATFFINLFFERTKETSTALEFPNASQDILFVHSNNLLKAVVNKITGTEIEENYNYYKFYFYCTSYILTKDKEFINLMDNIYPRIQGKTLDLVVRMSQAYVSSGDIKLIPKSISIIEEFEGDKIDLLYLINTINYSIIGISEKANENFSNWLALQKTINKGELLNIILLIRQGRLTDTTTTSANLTNLLANGNFVEVGYQALLRIFLFTVFKVGFEDKYQFYSFLKESEKYEELQDLDLLIHIAYSYASFEYIEDARILLKDKIDLNKPCEILKLYCKVLYKAEHHKKELIEILKNWRQKFELDYELLEMEAQLHIVQKNWTEVVQVSKSGLVKFPESEKLIYCLFLGFSEKRDLVGITEWAHIVKNKTFNNQPIGLLICSCLKAAGFEAEALELLYNQASIKNNLATRKDYIILLGQYSTELIKEYPEVVYNCFVKYSINNVEEIIEITEANKNNAPQKYFIGRKQNETFTVSNNFSGALESVTIHRISDKYIALLETILREAKNPLSGLDIHVVNTEEGVEGMQKLLISQFGAKGSLEKDRVDKMFDQYARGEISFSEMSISLFNKNFIDTYYALTSDNSSGFKAISPVLSSAFQFPLECKFALDFTAICLFANLSRRLKIDFKTKFRISDLTNAALDREIYLASTDQEPSLSLLITISNIRALQYSSDHKRERIENLKAIKRWVETNCIIEPLPEKIDYIWSLDENFREDAFFQTLVENSLLAKKDEFILLSDDVCYYRMFGCSLTEVVSPQLFLGRVFPDEIKQINNSLLSWNYIGIPITVEILKDEYFKQLAGQPNKFTVCLENLKASWNPIRANILESVKFIKEIYLSSLVIDSARTQVTSAIFSSLLSELPINLIRQVESLIIQQFKYLPKQQEEVLELFKFTILSFQK